MAMAGIVDSRLEICPIEYFPYVCIGSHAFAMFDYKNIYGYAYDPLPNIVCTAIWMPPFGHNMPNLATLLDYVVLSGPLLSVWSSRKKKNQRNSHIFIETAY